MGETEKRPSRITRSTPEPPRSSPGLSALHPPVERSGCQQTRYRIECIGTGFTVSASGLPLVFIVVVCASARLLCFSTIRGSRPCDGFRAKLYIQNPTVWILGLNRVPVGSERPTTDPNWRILMVLCRCFSKTERVYLSSSFFLTLSNTLNSLNPKPSSIPIASLRLASAS